MYKRQWLRVAMSFLLFAGAVTVGLIFLLNAAFQRLSHSEFVGLAEANAQFIRDSNIPATDRMASYMSQLLGMKVQFDQPAKLSAGQDVVTLNVKPGVDLTLVRERPTLRALLTRPITIVSLLVFWGLWFALAWAVAIPYFRTERLAMLGGMATAMAHEIRNPVSAIRLHGQLLGESDAATGGLIVGEASRIEDIVNQWMFLTRPAPPRRENVAVEDLLRRIAGVLAPSAEYAKVNVIIDSDSGWEISVDRQRMEQVFHNIMRNAVQAMPSGGVLTITARSGTISFADTGRGFSDKALRCWRKMLYTEKEGGMGVGLTVAESIVRAHGGRLAIANRSEGGAIVRVAL